MISHYTAIVFIITLSMGIMILAINGYKFMPSYKRRRFSLLFLLLIVVNIAEWLAATINGGDVDLRTLHAMAKFTEFVLTPYIPAVCVMALGANQSVKPFMYIVGANALVQVVSLFTGIVFNIDASNIYHRGDLYVIYVAFAVSSTVLLLIKGIQCSRQYQYKNVVFLGLILMLAMLGMTSQMFLTYLRLDWVCASIAAIMFYIYDNQLVQQVDDLTTLLNRRSYDYQVDKLKTTTDILFFDVDHFKNVNDTYGHSYGDDCLLCLASQIKRVFGKHGLCYRYGGDEFCVVMTRSGEDTQRLISTYLRVLNDMRLKDARLPHISIGYTTYNPDAETFQDAIDRADAMMYQYKELHHKQTSVNKA